MMAKRQGIFANEAAGCAGCSGLGSFTTGIFGGPTALGTSLASLGEAVVPAECWSQPAFTECQQVTFAQAQQMIYASPDFEPGTPDFDAAVNSTAANLVQQFCIPKCNVNAAPPVVTPPVTPPPVYNPPVISPPVTTTPPTDLAVFCKSFPKDPKCATTTTLPGLPGTGGVMEFVKSKFMGLPMYAWLGVGGVLIGVFIAMSRKQTALSQNWSY